MVKMKFKDAPTGARFKYSEDDRKTWVKLNSFPKSSHNNGDGLICEWKGNVYAHQNFCSFCDETYGTTYDTEIELIN